VLCWAVFKNNTFVQFTTGNSYSIPAEVDSAGYTIRAANEMGGLSESSNVVVYTNNVSGIDDVKPMAISQSWFTPDGKRIYKLDGFKGTVIVRTLYADGSIKTTKMVKVIY
jgi:hypothetical protein